MDKQLHVVLGGSGAIGGAVIKALQAKNLPIRAVERNKKPGDVPTILADLLDTEQAIKATQGASYVYLCIGLPYSANVWRSDWPKLMRSVIEACRHNGAKLIFFDNDYMYSQPLALEFDENTPQHPTTKKGVVRKQAADMLLSAHAAGHIQAVIGRSADFYGPGASNSMLYISFLDRILQGKNPQTLSKKSVPHTFAYTIDNGRALVELALDDGAYGKAWHLPVGAPTSFDGMLEIINSQLGTAHAISVMPKTMLAVLSLFIPIIKEVKEMLYRFDQPYQMSDGAFRARYPDFKTTSYRNGMASMIKSFQ